MLALSARQGPPPGGNLDHRRCIVHFDIDCFYAQASKRAHTQERRVPYVTHAPISHVVYNM